MLVRKLGLASKVYDSRGICRLPNHGNPLCDVNRLCFLLKLFMNSHSGFKRGSLDGYLDFIWVIMSGDSAAVLDWAMHNLKSLQYCKFCSKTPS